MSSAVARIVDRGGSCDPAPCQHVCHRESREAGRRAAGRLCLASLALSTDDDDVDVVSRRRADRAGRGDSRPPPRRTSGTRAGVTAASHIVSQVVSSVRDPFRVTSRCINTNATHTLSHRHTTPLRRGAVGRMKL